jgi:hypothetical protein
MGNWHLLIDDKLDIEFRETAFRHKGRKKGYLTDAVEEAMRLWLDHVKKEEHEGLRRRPRR